MRNVVHRSSAFWTAAMLGVASLAAASSALASQAAAGTHGRGPRHPAPALASPSDTGASNISNLGTGGWKVLSSANTTSTGAQISTPGFNTSSWMPVTNDDAGAPGTEVEALAQNGLCPGDTALQPVNQSTSGPNSVFFSNNMQLCYGSMNKIGSVFVSQWSAPRWTLFPYTTTWA